MGRLFYRQFGVRRTCASNGNATSSRSRQLACRRRLLRESSWLVTFYKSIDTRYIRPQVHFLDSPEQALLVIPIFSDIKPRGGGTYICPEGIEKIAKLLAAHPEGMLTSPGLCMTPSNSTYANPRDHPACWSHLDEVKRCHKFVELTGEVGDVVLLHPLMLHSASKNHLRIPRVITNPLVASKEPFNFNRENPEDYSLIEKTTLKALSVDRLDYRITTGRRQVVPERVRVQQKMLEEERKRVRELAESEPQPVAISVA